MTPLRILLVMLALVPQRSDRDVAYRYRLAQAIASVTDDVTEQDTLARIARWESGYRIDIATCHVNGDHGGAFGPFQVHPRSPEERDAVCTHLTEAVRVALDRVRESVAACGDLTGYVSGRCGVAVAEARLRWGR